VCISATDLWVLGGFFFFGILSSLFIGGCVPIFVMPCGVDGIWRREPKEYNILVRYVNSLLAAYQMPAPGCEYVYEGSRYSTQWNMDESNPKVY
jgi:hypothetical protein